MAGFVVIPEVEDFPRMTPEVLRRIYEDVTLSQADEDRLLWRLVRTQPRIEVSITASEQLRFEIIQDGAGPQTVTYREGGEKVQAVNMLGAEDYLLSIISLLPPQVQRQEAIRLRRELIGQKGLVQGGPSYVGLTEKADASARSAIDETWGMLE